jgi:hypothetical protein
MTNTNATEIEFEKFINFVEDTQNSAAAETTAASASASASGEAAGPEVAASAETTAGSALEPAAAETTAAAVEPASASAETEVAAPVEEQTPESKTISNIKNLSDLNSLFKINSPNYSPSNIYSNIKFYKDKLVLDVSYNNTAKKTITIHYDQLHRLHDKFKKYIESKVQDPDFIKKNEFTFYKNNTKNTSSTYKYNIKSKILESLKEGIKTDKTGGTRKKLRNKHKKTKTRNKL